MHKIIIVSGASKGLGFGITERLLSKGWMVAGFSRKTNKKVIDLKKKYKKKFIFELMDIKHNSRYEKFLDKIKKKGSIYGLINNAGTVNEDLLVRQNGKHIKNLLEINLLAPILFTKKVIKYMMINSSGRIVETAPPQSNFDRSNNNQIKPKEVNSNPLVNEVAQGPVTTIFFKGVPKPGTDFNSKLESILTGEGIYNPY